MPTPELCAHLANIVEFSEDAIISKDLSGQITTWNRGAERIFGYTAAEIVGKPVSILIPPNVENEGPGILERIQRGERVPPYETVRARKDGRLIHVSLSISPIQDASGNLVGASKIARDITERKQSQEEVLRAKQEWEHTFDSISDQIAIIDNQHRLVRVNRAMAAQLQQASSVPYLGRHCYHCVHGSAQPPEACPHARTLQDGREHVAEVYEQNLGGYFLVTTTPLFDGQGKVLGSVHVARDITERKRMEEMLRQTNQRLSAILDHTHMLVACLDREFNFLMVNRAYAHADGQKPDFFPGKNHFALYPHAENEAIFRRVVETGQPYFVYGKPFEYAHHPERGTSYWDWSLIPIKDNTGRVTQLVLTLLDVTKPKLGEAALRQAQTLLAQANQDLECKVRERTTQLEKVNHGLQCEIAERHRAEQALRETVSELEAFSYTVSHDLRAPLRSMRMFSTLLQEACVDIDPTARDYAARIAKSAQRMDSLVTDILAYSHLGRTELPLQAVDANKLLREMIDTYPELQSSRAQISVEGEIPLLLANEAALTQCFSNLLGNAVKFVAPGTPPRVRVWAEPQGPFVRLWFEDNGIGIPPAHQEKVFGIFERLSPSYEGTGIGLAIVKKAVEKIGGKVGVESEPGQGSRFWLSLRAIIEEQ